MRYAPLGSIPVTPRIMTFLGDRRFPNLQMPKNCILAGFWSTFHISSICLPYIIFQISYHHEYHEDISYYIYGKYFIYHISYIFHTKRKAGEPKIPVNLRDLRGSESVHRIGPLEASQVLHRVDVWFRKLPGKICWDICMYVYVVFFSWHIGAKWGFLRWIRCTW